jgi:hypothetical protein
MNFEIVSCETIVYSPVPSIMVLRLPETRWARKKSKRERLQHFHFLIQCNDLANSTVRVVSHFIGLFIPAKCCFRWHPRPECQHFRQRALFRPLHRYYNPARIYVFAFLAPESTHKQAYKPCYQHTSRVSILNSSTSSTFFLSGCLAARERNTGKHNCEKSDENKPLLIKVAKQRWPGPAIASPILIIGGKSRKLMDDKHRLSSRPECSLL